MPNDLVKVDHLKIAFDDHVVLQDINLSLARGEILALVGGSGSGKSTLLNALLMLLLPTSGSIALFGHNIATANALLREEIRKRWGILFQGGALFSELTVLENVLIPLKLHSTLPIAELENIALLKIAMAGLPQNAAGKYPRELSGGMIKRAALARAIALDPELLFLDEPSSGLDPISADALDNLILQFKANLGLTMIIVTHDLNTLATVPDKIAFLGKGKILACGTLDELLQSTQPEVQAYFTNPRAKRTFDETS